MTRHLRYLGRLARSVFTPEHERRRLRPLFALPGVILMVLAVAGALKAPATALGFTFDRQSRIDRLLERTRVVGASLQSVEGVYEQDIKPLERVLLHYRDEPRLVRRIATALVREGRRAEIDPDILMAVLLVENPWLNPDARSPVGARGLMQVMPGHRGQWKACPQNMDTIEGNICYGAQIFRDYLRLSKGNYETALLRYNGCVRGTNTPTCGQYPQHVFARAGRAAFLSRTTP
jgi:hypothetical protein